MRKRLIVCMAACLLVAGSALAGGINIYEAEGADELGTNYVVVVDTNVPPFAFSAKYITSTINRTAQPSGSEEEQAVYTIASTLTINEWAADSEWDLYLRIHVGPGAFNDDSIYVADGYWDDFFTNLYAGGDTGLNGLAGYIGLDGAATTAEGFHWVQTPNTYAVDFLSLYLQWACAPREDGLELDAFALVPAGFPATDEMLDPANAEVELWAGHHEPTRPSGSPTPLLAAYFLDGAETANTNSVTMAVDGVAVSGVSVSYANFVTSVSYTPIVPFVTPSTHTATVVVASSPGGTLVTNEFAFDVDNPITYIDATTNNTVMALSTNGPVEGGTAWITTPDNLPDGLWRERVNFGLDPGVINEPAAFAGYNGSDTIYESLDDNTARLKTSSTGLTESNYNVYVYFWTDQFLGWGIRAGLEDTAGSDSLPLYDNNSSEVTLILEDDAGPRRLLRADLGRVYGATSIDVYVEDGPSAGGNRTWFDGIGFQPVPANPVFLLSQSPTPDGYIIAPDDFPFSVGGEVVDLSETLDASSVEMYLDGTNVISGGDVVKVAATTTVSHVVSSLPDGTHSVDLVYATVEAPSYYYTNTWSFEVVTRPEIGNRVYVDADTTNTLAWTGAAFGAWVPDGAGNNWTTRTPWGNNDNVYQSAYTADSPRLKTTVTGLPDATYKVYGYFWAAVGASWRVEAALTNSVNPADELPVYTQSDYPTNANLYVHYQDGLGVEPWGMFDPSPTPNPYYSTDLLANPFNTNVVKLAHNDQRLVEVYLGTVSGTEITVYADDDISVSDQTERTWFDGIGYAVATGLTVDPVMQSFSVSGGTATMMWTSETAGTYSITRKTNLSDADWTPVKTGIAGGDPTTTDSVPVSGESESYFRIEGN